jgi:phenylalanyl-tRNA synthetase beta subunit
MESRITEKRRKHVLLNQPRLKKAQELLGAKTESETIERALERVITEAERDNDVWTAQERFVKALIKEDAEVIDVFGRLKP